MIDPNTIDPNGIGAVKWLAVNWSNILLAITSLVTAASIIVKITPSQKDDAILAKIIAVLKIISLNKGEPK